MYDVIVELLRQVGVEEFPGAALGLDDFTRGDLEGRYRATFTYDGPRQVVVVLTEEGVFIVDEFDQIWANCRRFGPGGIESVLRMPPATWEMIRSRLSSAVHDLTQV